MQATHPSTDGRLIGNRAKCYGCDSLIPQGNICSRHGGGVHLYLLTIDMTAVRRVGRRFLPNSDQKCWTLAKHSAKAIKKTVQKESRKARQGLENMHFYQNERVALFIDGANLYATSKALGFDIDYKRLLSHFRGKCHLVRALYYTALAEDQEYSSIRPLIDWLDYNAIRW